MGNIVNIEILGRPLNALVVIVLVVLFWYAVFCTFHGRIASFIPAATE